MFNYLKDWVNRKFNRNSVSDSTEFNDSVQYTDVFQTTQQQRRDFYVTDLLAEYTKAYKAKCKTGVILRPIYVIIVGVTILSVMALGYIIISTLLNNLTSTADIIAILTTLGGVLGTVVGLLKIVAEYIFPIDEEKYITDIVKAIQDNDLKTKKAFMDFDNTRMSVVDELSDYETEESNESSD